MSSEGTVTVPSSLWEMLDGDTRWNILGWCEGKALFAMSLTSRPNRSALRAHLAVVEREWRDADILYAAFVIQLEWRRFIYRRTSASERIQRGVRYFLHMRRIRREGAARLIQFNYRIQIDSQRRAAFVIQLHFRRHRTIRAIMLDYTAKMLVAVAVAEAQVAVFEGASVESE